MCFFEKFAKVTLCSVGLLAAGTLPATDYTWKYGGTDYKWSNPGNWLVNGEVATDAYPKAGDTAIFSSTYVKAMFTTASETVALGEGTLTIQSNVEKTYAYIGTTFTGAAKVVKTGSGRLVFAVADNKWTGGTEVWNGTLYASVKGKETFGTGIVTIKPDADTSNPRISPASWGALQITNRIDIVTDPSFTPRTTTTNYSVYSSNGGNLKGPIYSDGDFVVGAGSSAGGMVFSGDIHASGHTLYVYVSSTMPNSDRRILCEGSVDAHLVLNKNSDSEPHSRFQLSGRSDFVDNKMTIIAGTNEFTQAAAYWGGTNIVINPNSSKYAPRLKVASAENLNPEAVITIKTGGYIEVPSGVSLKIRKLIVDGTDVGTGCFTAADYSCIEGGGLILIGMEGAVWTGGSAGAWSDTANWDGGVVPKAGTVANFTKSVYLTGETVDFSDPEHPGNSLILGVASGKTLTSSNVFAGASAILKAGTGTWDIRADNTYSGGTVIMDGYITISGENIGGVWKSPYSPGTGTVEIRRSGAFAPYLELTSWCVLTNDVLITGPYKVRESNVGDIKFNNIDYFYSDIEARDGAFRFHNQYNNPKACVRSYGDISAHGLTMYVTTREDASHPDKEADAAIEFYGTVNADIEKNAQRGTVRFCAGSQIGSSDSTLTLYAATNVAYAATQAKDAAQILAGTIAIDSKAGKGAALRLRARENLRESANVVLTNGGKLIIDSGVRARVASLTVSGEAVPNGVYTAATLPDAIVGEGRIRVGKAPGVAVLFR